jgi:hypothetical protein
MDQVHDNLWISDWHGANDLKLIRRHDIRGVLTLTHAPLEHYRRGTTRYEKISFADASDADLGAIHCALVTLIALHRHDPPALVHCGAGHSRATALAATYLHWAQGGDLRDWLEHCWTVRGAPRNEAHDTRMPRLMRRVDYALLRRLTDG